jgi:hypothetical protein
LSVSAGSAKFSVFEETALFDLDVLKKARVVAQCVCCGNTALKSSPAILMPFIADRVFGWKPTVIDESWGLLTIQKGHAYTLCKSLFCENCDHLFCDIRFTDAEMGMLYNDYRGAEYVRLRDFYEPGYALRNEALEQNSAQIRQKEAFLRPLLDLPNTTMLDWGGDTGENTPFRNEIRSFDIYEISSIDVIEGARAVDKAHANSHKYGLIVCSHVLEHVPFPTEVVMDMAQSMDENSILYVEVPFEKIMYGDLHLLPERKRHWHEHVNFYTQKSLAALAESCGMQVVAANNFYATIEETPWMILQMACKLA